MPRQARQKSNSGIYHVMLRGNNRATIFHDDEDCERFLEDLRKCLPGDVDAGMDAEGRQAGVESPQRGQGEPKSPWSPQWGQSLCPSSAVKNGQSPLLPCPSCDVKNGQSPLPGDDGSSASGTVPLSHRQCEKWTVPDATAIPAVLYAYCLMGNHVHLLLREGSEDISRMMKRIAIRFASFYRWKYQHIGHVFQDRFRSEPVNDDRYFLSVYRYIVLNPVKAGLAEAIGEYPWCNYRSVSSLQCGQGVPQWGQSLCPACGVKNGQSPLLGGQSPMQPTLPVDITPEQLDSFIRSAQPEIHPFRERIPDREAEAVLLQVSGLHSIGEFIHLPKAEQMRLFPILYENDLSVLQISRLTGVPKSNIARYLA